MQASTLGISLGSRLLGMALRYNGKLCHYRVRTFYGAWTEEKRLDMIATLRKTIQKYGVVCLSVKTPKASHCSRSITELMRDIRQLAQELSITLIVCTITHLTKRFCGPVRGNKQGLMQGVVARYPEHPRLAELHAKEKRNHSKYHVRIFEAIACLELA